MDAETHAWLESTLRMASPERERVHEAMYKAASAAFDLFGEDDASAFAGSMLANAIDIFASCFEPGDRDVAGTILGAWIAERVGMFQTPMEVKNKMSDDECN
jgi:hypothetical protein